MLPWNFLYSSSCGSSAKVTIVMLSCISAFLLICSITMDVSSIRFVTSFFLFF